MTTLIQPTQTIILLYTAKRLNIAEVDNIRKSLLPWITLPNKRIIIDLQQVCFMDCCAVSCIIMMDRIAQTHHSVLTLCNLMGSVQLLADTLKLSAIINIEKNMNPPTRSRTPNSPPDSVSCK